MLGLRPRIPPGDGWLSLVNVACCVGSGVCYGPIPRPGETCRMYVCVTECDQTNIYPLHLQWVGRRGQNKKGGNSTVCLSCLHTPTGVRWNWQEVPTWCNNYDLLSKIISTYFGHLYAHLQEYRLYFYCIWCSALGVVAVVPRSRCVVLCTVCRIQTYTQCTRLRTGSLEPQLQHLVLNTIYSNIQPALLKMGI
jgi:hypothetical protein